MGQSRSVAISIYVGTGSRHEPPDEAGISHLLEHLCFKGTKRRPTPQDIAEVIDGVGGFLNGATDQELTVYYAKVAGRHFDLALDVLMDMIHSPLLDEREFEKERHVVLEELSSASDSPPQLADLLIDATLWPSHSLGRDVGGTVESVSAITLDMTRRYLRRQYVPNNIVVAIAGDPQAADHRRAVDAVRRTLGDWPSGDPASWIPVAMEESGRNEPICSVRYKQTEQAHLNIAFIGLPMDHPDRHALSLLSVMLGEGMSSRLFLELREKHGLAYDVHSSVTHFRDTGAFTIAAAIDPKNAIRATEIIVAELARIRDEVISESELGRAKELSQGRLLLQLEEGRAVSAWAGSQQMLRGHIRTPEEVIAAMMAVTVEGVASLAGRLLTSDGIRMAVVGPFRSNRRFLAALHRL